MKIENLKKNTLIIVKTKEERERMIALFKQTASPIPKTFEPNDTYPNIFIGLFNHRFGDGKGHDVSTINSTKIK